MLNVVLLLVELSGSKQIVNGLVVLSVAMYISKVKTSWGALDLLFQGIGLRSYIPSLWCEGAQQLQTLGVQLEVSFLGWRRSVVTADIKNVLSNQWPLRRTDPPSIVKDLPDLSSSTCVRPTIHKQTLKVLTQSAHTQKYRRCTHQYKIVQA